MGQYDIGDTLVCTNGFDFHLSENLGDIISVVKGDSFSVETSERVNEHSYAYLLHQLNLEDLTARIDLLLNNEEGSEFIDKHFFKV